MTDRRRVAAVTGASGYLGSRLCTTLEARGWQVLRLVRSPDPADPGSRSYRIGAPIGAGLLASVDLLVHAAYDFSLTRRSDIWRVNVEGTRRLLAEAREAGVDRILVLSTMSAYAGTTQLYGQAKLAIEAATAAVGGCAIRPGLVYSSEPAGMAGALQKVGRLPVVPLVAGGARQYPVHLDDLMAAIGTLAEADSLPAGPIGIANPSSVSFRDVMVALAAQEGRRCRFVPFPWRLLYWGLRAGELLPVRLPFRADSLLGLVYPAPSVPGVDEAARLGIGYRAFNINPDERANT